MIYVVIAALFVALVIVAVTHHVTLKSAHATIDTLIGHVVKAAYRPTAQTVTSGYMQPITTVASNTPAGAVAGQVSQNGVTDAQRNANFAAWKAKHPNGSTPDDLWQDPWLFGAENYAGTQVSADQTAPPKTAI